MLWTEKYRPRSFHQVAGNAKQIKEIEEWVDNWLKGDKQPCLFLLGPPGTGKTTLAHIIGSEFSDYVELNASDKRSYDLIKKTVGEASLSRHLFTQGLKLIILDEVDGIHGTDDRGGSRAINKIIQEGQHPLILTANDPYSKRITSFKSKCKVIKLKKIHTNSIAAYLKRICLNEGIEFDDKVLKELAKRSNGDMRSAINDLEVIAQGQDRIDSSKLDILGLKDSRYTVFDSVRRVLKSKNLARVRDAMYIDEEPGMVLELMAENIPREYEKAHEIEDAYEMISQADLYLGRATLSRNYSYWRYASDFMGPGVAMAKDDTYHKFARYAGSSSFKLLAKNRSKRNLRDRVADKIAEKLHISRKVAISQFPYWSIIFENDEMAYEWAQFLDLEDAEVKLFRSRKIKIPKKIKVNKKNKQKIKSGIRGIKAEDERKSSGKFEKNPPKDHKTRPPKKSVSSKQKESREDLEKKNQTSLFQF